MDSEIRLKFLGIRAIHDMPSPNNALYGGSTNCIVLQDHEEMFFINAGFGANPYGDQLIREALATKNPVRCHFFLSDFLWDNISGLPMFTPIHFKKTQMSIHSALPSKEAKSHLSSICSSDVSPFNGVDSLNAQLNFPEPKAKRAIGNWKVSLLAQEHPIAPYPYAVWLFEHKTGLRVAFSPHAPKTPARRQELLKLLDSCNVLVQSAIAPEINMPTMAGRWTFEEAVRFGQEAKAEHTFITGVHPILTDRDLIRAELDLCRKLEVDSGVDFSIAREWSTIHLPFSQLHKKVG